VSPVNTPSQANVMSDFYHPMRNLRRPIDFDVTSGFSVCQICSVMYAFLLL
jgi:hypothetical protein